MGDADLARKLGTLRYLKGLQAARQRALAAATPDAPQPSPFVYSKGQLCLRASRSQPHCWCTAGRQAAGWLKFQCRGWVDM